MKNILTFWLLILTTIQVLAQNKFLILTHKQSKDSVFLEEFRRIKIVTKDGQKLTGNFKIKDEKTIEINNETIALETIIKIRKKSQVSAILEPIAIGLGVILVPAGIAGAADGGLGGAIAAVFGIGVGTPLLILPLTTKMHPVEKWNYSIDSKP